jgi:hypothetical protein
METQFGYFVTRRLSLQAIAASQITHSGLDFPQDFPIRTPTNVTWTHHDQISTINFLNMGGGIAYAITKNWQVYSSLLTTVWGQNGRLADRTKRWDELEFPHDIKMIEAAIVVRPRPGLRLSKLIPPRSSRVTEPEKSHYTRSGNDLAGGTNLCPARRCVLQRDENAAHKEEEHPHALRTTNGCSSLNESTTRFRTNCPSYSHRLRTHQTNR